MTAEYPPTYYILAEAIAVTAVTASVLAIGKKVGAIAKRVTLQPYILPQVGVLMGGEVSIKRENIVVQAGIVQV